MAIFISDKVGFRAKKITRDKEGLYIDKSANFPRSYKNPKYVWLKNRALQYTKQQSSELKGKIDTSIIIFRDLKTPLSAIDKVSREKNFQVCRTEHHIKTTGSNWYL